MRITIVGTGYVGLVTGVCLADFGHDVTCVDKDRKKIDGLNTGVVPIYEPGLDVLIEKNLDAGRLAFSCDLPSAMESSRVIFIAVGTPAREEDGSANLSYVYSAAEEIAENLESGSIIVNKSTVPVGTGDEVEEIIRNKKPKMTFSVVSNPEFLREGVAISDFKTPDRVVVGTNDENSRQIMQELYRPLLVNKIPMVFTSRRTSELIKYAANAFLATKITFINEIADLCERVGANVKEVSLGIGLDDRIGPKFLNAGPGFGGSCFPKDTLALLRTANGLGLNMSIVNSVVTANDNRKQQMAVKILDAIGDSAGKTIAILGLSFKPNTDDVRYSPSLDIIKALQEKGVRVKAFDPQAMDEAKQVLTNVEYCKGPYDCVENADAVAILTEWKQFGDLDFGRIKKVIKTPTLIDLRNIYESEDIKNQGFKYVSVGRN